MDWLRSRWTVIALAPAFFLAGFGIVSALDGGSDDPDLAAAGSTGAADAGPPIRPVLEETGPTDTSSGLGVTTSSSGGGEASGAGGAGGAPPAPPPGAIDVDYGRWDGAFELMSPQIVQDFPVASVIGELRYLGGVDCSIGLVKVRTWFYNGGGLVVGETVWESVQSTGPGAEVTGREPLPFEAYGQVAEGPSSAALRFTAVGCL